ncbi:MAG TPA: hypothetical protein VMT53_07830 [Terriglobales bacterium]|nr:hypothetical protein [Terriglobales bacterium]
MSSNRSGTARAAVGAGAPDDGPLKAITNLIPVEVIAVYNLVITIFPAQPPELRFWFTIVMIPITGLYIAFGTKDGDEQGIAWRQALIAPFAFACWTSAMQGAMLMAMFPWWRDWIGGVAVGVGTLLLPILNGVLRAIGVPQN